MIQFQDDPFNISKLFCLLILVIPELVSCEFTCEAEEAGQSDNTEALKYKLGSIGSILVAGGVGVSLPLLGKRLPALNPQSDIFFMVKAFAAGVILATGFIHILPDAFNNLTSPCLKENPWGKFPFTGFVAMMSSIGTLMVDSFATGYYKRQHVNNSKLASADEEMVEQPTRTHVHAHLNRGSSHSSNEEILLPDRIRRRIIPQVLELGIVVHSVIIGVSLGAAESPGTIKPLLMALSFHQFFEGIGLGGCISQAEFKSRAKAIMATFFSLTTPIGIGVGMGITRVYKRNSPTALIVEGIFNSASAGILIYMALVDLLTADFMNPRLQSNVRLQFAASASLLLGIGCMSFLAIWT